MLCSAYRLDYGPNATAICMAGGYVDDDDTGEEFTYTGAGGQRNKRQVRVTCTLHMQVCLMLQQCQCMLPLSLSS